MKQQFNPPNLYVCEFGVEGCAKFGLEELRYSLRRNGTEMIKVNHWTKAKAEALVLIIGTSKNRRVQILLENAGIDYRLRPESLFVQWCDIPGSQALVVAGVDDVGLMYNLLELARRVDSHAISALNEAVNLTEEPHNRVRCVDRYLLGHLDDEWFKSEQFWHYLLGRMARARFNRFCLILGFDTAYMSPPYPFFLESASYTNVIVKDLTPVAREENLAALRKIGTMCHTYGMKFVFATWQQRPWTTKQAQLVTGLPEDLEGLKDYCYNGLKTLITAVPEIDIVQFRVNHESGVGDQVSAEDFWKHCTDAVADVAAETGRKLVLDLRAKGLTDSMVDHAFSRGLAVEVPTKYWCEHAALPYHIPIMRSEELAQLDNYNHSRRYSYADMLRKPRYYDVIYRLWNYGSTNLFLWGDADYARRFSMSCRLSGSAGFQINTPLSLKYGHELSHKVAWKTFAKEELRSGKWEDERFWMWYTAFGRLGYNPDTEPMVWQEEFSFRFGEAGRPLEKTLAAASKIVPLVTTAHMPVHPSLRYWTELNTGWALFVENNLNKPALYDFQSDITYGSTEPSDHGLFYGIDEYAGDFTAGTLSGKYSPLQIADWLDELAKKTIIGLEEAESLIKEKVSPEYQAMKVDMMMLCHFARYHAEKMRAALAIALWRLNKDKSYLGDAIVLLDSAISYWNALAEAGSENYYHDLNFSSAGSDTRRGTWTNLSVELEADKKTLADLLEANVYGENKELARSWQIKSSIVGQNNLSARFPEVVRAGMSVIIDVLNAGLGEPEATPVLHYRHTDQTEGLFHITNMNRTALGFSAVIPGDYVSEEWDLQIYITIQGTSGTCQMLPGIYHPDYPYPYHVITVTK